MQTCVFTESHRFFIDFHLQFTRSAIHVTLALVHNSIRPTNRRIFFRVTNYGARAPWRLIRAYLKTHPSIFTCFHCAFGLCNIDDVSARTDLWRLDTERHSFGAGSFLHVAFRLIPISVASANFGIRRGSRTGFGANAAPIIAPGTPRTVDLSTGITSTFGSHNNEHALLAGRYFQQAFTLVSQTIRSANWAVRNIRAFFGFRRFAFPVSTTVAYASGVIVAGSTFATVAPSRVLDNDRQFLLAHFLTEFTLVGITDSVAPTNRR